VIDSRSEEENAPDSMHLSCAPLSNETDESDLQSEKHDEQRISACRGIVIDEIGWPLKQRPPLCVTRSLAAREGKKADDGTMTSQPDTKPTTVAGPANGQTLTPAMMTSASDILTTNNV
jgi:hypothetical protein